MIDWQDLHHSDLSVSQLYALITTALCGICSGTKLSLPGYRW
ncbi:protein elaA [Escherichia coli UMEA 3341-1]|nr:protein elaA [Escherichia coli UMEA 3341-1]